MLITVFSISCKNNATMSEFAYENGTFEVDVDRGIEQFLDNTFISDSAITADGIYHLWFKVTDTGVVYTQNPKNSEPNFTGAQEIPLSAGLNKNENNTPGYYAFSGVNPLTGGTSQAGTLKFENGGKLTVTFSQGTSYNNQAIACQYVVW